MFSLLLTRFSVYILKKKKKKKKKNQILCLELHSKIIYFFEKVHFDYFRVKKLNKCFSSIFTKHISFLFGTTF
jgi:hypothetical protein